MRRFPAIALRAAQAAVVLAILLIFGAGMAQAQLPTIVRVEEDWELVVGAPDSVADAPQVSCTIAPVGNVNSVYATFVLNHQSLPGYTAGGLQLQIWDGDLPVADRKFPNPSVMSIPGEVVTWTQTMRIAEGLLHFEVTSGSSTTWGPFGGQGYLNAAVSTTLSDLTGYQPAVSVANSGVTFAANRVSSLVLKRVRLVTAAGEILEDATERPVGLQN